jgi:hypothetical protein
MVKLNKFEEAHYLQAEIELMEKAEFEKHEN